MVRHFDTWNDRITSASEARQPEQRESFAHTHAAALLRKDNSDPERVFVDTTPEYMSGLFKDKL